MLIMHIYCIFLVCLFVHIPAYFVLHIAAYFVHISAYLNMHIMAYLVMMADHDFLLLSLARLSPDWAGQPEILRLPIH